MSKFARRTDDLTHPIGLVVPEHAVLDREVAQQQLHLLRNASLFLNYFYVCPEPVLTNVRFLVLNGSKKAVGFRTAPPSPRFPRESAVASRPTMATCRCATVAHAAGFQTKSACNNSLYRVSEGLSADCMTSSRKSTGRLVRVASAPGSPWPLLRRCFRYGDSAGSVQRSNLPRLRGPAR